MSDPVRVLKVLETHKINCHLGLDREGIRGGLMVGSEYVWFTNGADIVLYSKTTGCVESSRSFGGDAQTDNLIEITFVQELHKSEETMNMLLVGCSCKTFGLLFVCQLPTLMVIRCIHIPSPISYISTINNETLAQDQLCDKFKIMSTVLLVGMITGEVYAVDLRKRHIENQLRNNEIVVNESSPSKLFILRKNDDCREAKKICDNSDFHLAMFINEKFYNFYKRQCSGQLNFNISCLLYTEEIHAVAIGYITGHFQLWDCKIMQTLYVFKKPECYMPITHITFLEPADDPNNLCYLWIIQSDNSRLPNAMMIALSYEHRIIMSNGHCSYRGYKKYNIKLKMLLRRESGIGRCISALTLCNDTLVRKSIGVSQNCGITLFAMLMEIRQNVDTSPKSYIFLFDINQWNKGQMPSIINHLKVSNSYASFVELPDYASYLDFNISNILLTKTWRPFGSNFEKFHYPSSIYFECECLLDTKIIRFKHVGVQQEVLDKLVLNSWSLFGNPSLLFRQCLQTNLKPFFWDKTYDYKNYTLLDKLHFVVSIIVENNIMSVFDECVKKWKNGTHSEVIILHLVECLWNHVMLVKQYADQLCVPLFDCSGAPVGKKNSRILIECLSQMLSVENIFKRMQFTDCVQIVNVDLFNRVKIINLVTQYFNAIIYFINLQMLPKQIEENPTCQIIRCDFTSLIQYASKRRMEFGNMPLYLIDAIVTNEPNGNKLIEQWKHECIEETKGLYPPTSVQCLLRIYLNAELSNQIKDFITIYFLIDVCSVQKMDEITANIFNNTLVKNKELYKLCCASWYFDHDMFEDAMIILASNNEWMVNDKSWNWYHWTVLKLFVFKKQYYWAQIYFELFDIKLVNLDDHKFYVNLQIMNNHCFDALCHLNLTKIEEKIILFEYIFDRCRHTNQLKTFLSYPLDPDEKKLFFSCLKKFEDTKLIQFMFLVQEKRYSEALELCKSLKVNTNSKHDYILSIVSDLVGKITDKISSNNKSDLKKKVFSNEEIKMTFMNCFMDDQINMIKPYTFRSYDESCQINLIVPNDDIVDRIQDLGEKVSTINGVLSTSKIETVIQIENKLLKLLDTPFIQNISTLPSITSLAVPKKTSTDNKLLSTIKLDKTSETLTFGLPDNNDSKVEKFSHKKVMSMKNIIPENVKVRNSETNNLPINMITEQSPTTFHKLLKDNSKIKLLETAPIPCTVDNEKYDKMDISENDHSVLPDGEYKYYLEELDVLLDNEIDKNNSEELNIILEVETEDNIKESDEIHECENYKYVEEPDIILDDSINTNNSEQPDVLQEDGVSVENHLYETSILPDCDNEDYFKEPDIIIDDANYYNRLEQPDVIHKGDIGEKLEESDVILDDDKSVENHLDQLSVIPNVEDEDNLGEPYDILEGENYEYVEEPYIILDNSEQPDNIFDDDLSAENHLDETSILPDVEIEDDLKESDILECENYEYVEEPEIKPDNSNDTNNSEQPDDLHDEKVSVENHSDQHSGIPYGEVEDNLEESNVIHEGKNYDCDVEEPDIILDDSINTNNSEQPDDLQDEKLSVENHSEQLCVIPDGKNEDNLEESDVIHDGENYDYDVEEPNIILDNSNDTNNSEQPDDLHDEKVSVENHSDQHSGIPYGEVEDNLEESNVIHEGKNYDCDVEEPDIILDDSINTNNSEQPDDLQDEKLSVENHSEQLCVIPDGKNEDNLEESDVIHDGENYDYDVEEPNIILDNSNDTNNSEQPDDLHDEKVSVENHSDQHSGIPYGEVEDNLEESNVIHEGKNYDCDVEEPDIILDDSINTNNSEQPDDLQDEKLSVENHSEQLCVIPDGKNEDNLEESDVIHDGENYDCDVEEPNIILDDSNNTNNSEQPDDLYDENVSVENYSDQLSVIPDGENEDNLEESDVILESENKENSEEAYAIEQNIIKSFESLKSEKTPKNNVMVDHDNVICPTVSQSNMLENLTPYIYGLTEENRSNDDSKIIITEKENENYLGNIVDGNQTSVIIKEDDIAEVVENTDSDNNPTTPINFEIIENPKEDLCNNQNENYLYDEYQFSNNYILPELSTIEFNPIPEYGFNHLTMTGNESNQLETYETLNQPTSVFLNESFLNNISLGRTGDVIETQDSVVDNSAEIVIDKISEIVEPSSSNTTINTNLYNNEIKSYQLVESKDIAYQQVDTAKREYAVEIQNSCPSAASEPSKTLIIKEFPTNSMLYKDILIQEETSKLVNFIESEKNSAGNVHNLSTDKKNEQPFIEQKIKNIPNLRKRRNGTKCIPYSDTKLAKKSISESKTKQVELKIISSNISSPTSDIFEDCLVSMSKKRPKCQKKIALIKRRRVSPKYVASKDKVSNNKIDLEQISGERTTNKDKYVKKIDELLPNNLPNKDTESLEELTKLAVPIKINPEAENNKKILNLNVSSRTKNVKCTSFFLEPKLILKKLDVSLYKNRFKLLAMDNTSHVSLSNNKRNSQKPISLTRLRKGCLKSMKEPKVTNTIIDLNELKEDSINNDKYKAKKSKLSSSYKIKKVEFDKNLKSSPDRRVVTLSMSDTVNCLNKIHNSSIDETINLISDDEFVSDKVQDEMGKINPDKEKLDWKIISHEVKTNTDAIPKIRIGRNKSELNTVSVGSQLDKRNSTTVLEQELGLKKKSSESKILKFNQQVCRRSSRKILKKQKCSCCTNKLMDGVCSSNVL